MGDAERSSINREIIIERGVIHGKSIHNVNPAFLIEKIVREKIFDSTYWKENCFGLNAATLCDKAVELKYIGGHYANQRPSPFLCLLFKIIQLQPEREIILAYLNNKYFKYLTALAAFYIRLTFSSVDIYKLLEPFLADYRKLRLKFQFETRLTYMDEYIDDLLNKEKVCDIILPRLTKRIVLEDNEELEPRERLIESESESESGSGSGSENENENESESESKSESKSKELDEKNHDES